MRTVIQNTRPRPRSGFEVEFKGVLFANGRFSQFSTLKIQPILQYLLESAVNEHKGLFVMEHVESQ